MHNPTWRRPNPGPQEARGEAGNKGFPGEKPDWGGDTGEVIQIQEGELQTSKNPGNHSMSGTFEIRSPKLKTDKQI